MADKRDAKLVLSVESQGASKAAKDVARLGDEAKSLKNDFKGAADEARNLTSALDDYERRRSQLGSGVEVAGDVASSTAGLRGALDVFSGGNSGVAGQVLEVAEAFADVGEFAPKAALQVQTLATSFSGVVSASSGLGASLVGTLTPALGAAGAGMAVFAAAALPIAAILGAAALAIKAYGDAAQEQANQFNDMIDAQRSLDDRIAEGLSTEAAEAEAASIEKRKQLELDRLAELEAAYASFEAQAGSVAGTLAKIVDAREEALVEQINKSKEALSGYDSEINALTDAIKDGKTTASETAKTTEAATKSERDLSSARQNADTATRTARENERKAQQERDKAQQEAEQARQKAQQEAEQRAEKAANAQQQYQDAVRNATTQYKQSVQDIGTKLKQTLTDNQTSLFRDVTDIATKYRRDEYNDTLKANRSERDALTKQLRDIEDIRADARETELDALREGDFKALFLARESGAKELRENEKTANRERSDRQRALQDAREDLLRNAQQTRSDRMLAYERQNTDARLAQSRELQQAALTRQRALQVASQGLNAELQQLGSYYQQRLKLDQQYYEKSLGMASGGTTIGRSSGATNNPYAGVSAVASQSALLKAMRK